MRKALVYILDHQILEPGDWAMTVKGVAPGGWAFERANMRYPDVDDTALGAARARQAAGARAAICGRASNAAIERALAWTFGMQSANGGWAAFDRDNDKAIISKIPFCNFGEALDPPSVDVTAHVVEALAELGLPADDPRVAKALAFIHAEQEPEGSWFGRWGVNHIYGVGAVLPALAAIGEDMRAPRIRKAAAWLSPSRTPTAAGAKAAPPIWTPTGSAAATSTPAQTAWALMALMAAGGEADRPRDRARLRASRRQRSARTEPGTRHHYTATGFPGYGVGARIDLRDPLLQEKLGQGPELSRGFMISFNMYRHYFPMIALARRAKGYEAIAGLPIVHARKISRNIACRHASRPCPPGRQARARTWKINRNGDEHA